MNTTTFNKIVPMTDDRLTLIIAGWLDEHKQSAKTKKAYSDTLADWRKGLQRKGLDLDSQGDREIADIQIMAQAFASGSKRPGKTVTNTTKNQRLAILSSFYRYAIGKRIIRDNPVEASQVKRAKVQDYAHSRAYSPETTRDGLAAIDRETAKGKRDYALLVLALETGQRIQAIAALDLQHLTLEYGQIIVTYAHTKGNEEMRCKLRIATSNALLVWLTAFYGESLALGITGDDRPVWVSLARGGKAGCSYGKPLGMQAIADVGMKYLHDSSFHRTRHTFAHAMEAAGAPVSEIQAKLGHKSMLVTGRYLAQLAQAENKYSDKIAEMLGIE